MMSRECTQMDANGGGREIVLVEQHCCFMRPGALYSHTVFAVLLPGFSARWDVFVGLN